MPIYESVGFGNDLHLFDKQAIPLTLSQLLDLGKCHKVQI